MSEKTYKTIDTAWAAWNKHSFAEGHRSSYWDDMRIECDEPGCSWSITIVQRGTDASGQQV